MTTPSRDSKLRHRFAIVAAAALFATGGAAIKATHLDGWAVAGGRSAVAALTLALAFPESRRGWTRAHAHVGVAFALTLVLFVLGNKLTTGANAIFLQSAAPLYLVALSPWLLRERIRRPELVQMAVLGAGLSLFYLDATAAIPTAPEPLLGNALATCAGLTWALTLAGLRWLEHSGEGGGMRSVVVGNTIAALICLLPVALGPAPAAGARDVVLLVYLGTIQIGLAYALLTYGFRKLGAIEGALLVLLEPALSPLLTWAIQGERPSALALSGGALIVTSSAAKAAFDGRAAKSQ